MENARVYRMVADSYVSAHLLNEMTDLFESTDYVDLLRNAAHRYMVISTMVEDTVGSEGLTKGKEDKLKEAKYRFTACSNLSAKLQVCLDEMDQVFTVYKQVLNDEFVPKEIMEQWHQNMVVSMKLSGELRMLQRSLGHRIAV